MSRADAEGIAVVEVVRSLVERGVLANSALEAHSRSARVMTRWGKCEVRDPGCGFHQGFSNPALSWMFYNFQKAARELT